MIRARVLAIAMSYEDADDLDHLRSDPAFKLACRRLPDTGDDLCSQPTLSRLENAPRLRDVIGLTYALLDAWMDSYAKPPRAVTLDIDDTCDVAHGHQQLSQFNAHYEEHCFLPIHVYDTATNRSVACAPARRRRCHLAAAPPEGAARIIEMASRVAHRVCRRLSRGRPVQIDAVALWPSAP